MCCKRTVTINYAQDRPGLTVFANSFNTPVADTTTDIDFADDALANPMPVSVRCIFNNANKFVSGYAGIVCVSADQLEVSSADTCARYPDTAFAIPFSERHVAQY